MLFFKRIYLIRGWNSKGKRRYHLMTARGLCNRIIDEASKSNYNWIAPASELVRIIKKPHFPYDDAKPIMICILNCYADLETMKEVPSNKGPNFEDAILYCYNTLCYSTDREAQKARRDYFKALLNSICKYNNDLQMSKRFGEAYKKIITDWKNSMELEYFKTEPVKSLIVLKADMKKELNIILKNADENGVFDEDSKKYWKNFIISK